MARSPLNSTEFASALIANMKDSVDRVEIDTPYSFSIYTRRFPTARIGVLSSIQVTADDVQRLLEVDPDVEFIVNIPKAGIWQGAAIQVLGEAGIAFGPIKHLMSAVGGRRDEEVLRDFIHAETKYFQTILTQHGNLHRLIRLTDLVYEVHRKNGPPLLVAGLNEYELAGATIRAAVAQHGQVSVIFCHKSKCLAYLRCLRSGAVDGY
ncbi:hypothetical protein [Pseudomonas syringae]|uniref:hypothetical protein n=1 Tax=Pseudomonas syringae TaxID=317 RepID=UPI0011D03D44|nr:hypothetical protein [Pseudomonas syringae]